MTQFGCAPLQILQDKESTGLLFQLSALQEVLKAIDGCTVEKRDLHSLQAQLDSTENEWKRVISSLRTRVKAKGQELKQELETELAKVQALLQGVQEVHNIAVIAAEVPVQNQDVQEVPVQNQDVQEVPVQNQDAQNPDVQEVFVQSQNAQEVPVQNQDAQDAPVQNQDADFQSQECQSQNFEALVPLQIFLSPSDEKKIELLTVPQTNVWDKKNKKVLKPIQRPVTWFSEEEEVPPSPLQSPLKKNFPQEGKSPMGKLSPMEKMVQNLVLTFEQNTFSVKYGTHTLMTGFGKIKLISKGITEPYCFQISSGQTCNGCDKTGFHDTWKVTWKEFSKRLELFCYNYNDSPFLSNRSNGKIGVLLIRCVVFLIFYTMSQINKSKKIKLKTKMIDISTFKESLGPCGNLLQEVCRFFRLEQDFSETELLSLGHAAFLALCSHFLPIVKKIQ